MPLDDAWARLVDDAAIFPPGDAPLHEATAAYAARSPEDGAELVGTFVLKDTDLPLVRGFGGPLSVVVTGGAGQLAGPVGLCAKLGLNLAGIEIAVRDLDDPAGNVRRVVAALRDVETDVPIYVELPATPAEGGWLAAADVAAEAELLLKFRTGGLEAAAFPAAEVLAGWIDAALDRETPFKCTAGLHNAVRHTGEDGFEHHGFVNVLRRRPWRLRRRRGRARSSSVPRAARPAQSLLVERLRELDLAGARRWFPPSAPARSPSRWPTSRAAWG